jgi:hypothetical protein
MAKKYHSATGSGEGKFCDLPTEMKITNIPDVHSPLPSDYEDTMSGVDSQIRSDESKRNSIFKGRKA